MFAKYTERKQTIIIVKSLWFFMFIAMFSIWSSEAFIVSWRTDADFKDINTIYRMPRLHKTQKKLSATGTGVNYFSSGPLLKTSLDPVFNQTIGMIWVWY